VRGTVVFSEFPDPCCRSRLRPFLQKAHLIVPSSFFFPSPSQQLQYCTWQISNHLQNPSMLHRRRLQSQLHGDASYLRQIRRKGLPGTPTLQGSTHLFREKPWSPLEHTYFKSFSQGRIRNTASTMLSTPGASWRLGAGHAQ
jgi:hypothetical protein